MRLRKRIRGCAGVHLTAPRLVRGDTRGQALIEFALVIPLLFVLILGTVDFGGFFFSWITVAEGTHAGAQYTILGDASPNQSTTPTGYQVVRVITADVASLPSSAANTTQAVCQNNNGSTVSLSGTCTAIPADPESGSSPYYVLASVDVTYTYHPFIPLFDVPSLGISLPPIFAAPFTVHRRTVMRMVQ